ncbi:MAG: hypothetical protein JWM78_3456 [Verrucomicrobiaceae bacterium]|nr:hypothetical protein [Verrucomicrobiaceae bacterium]
MTIPYDRKWNWRRCHSRVYTRATSFEIDKGTSAITPSSSDAALSSIMSPAVEITLGNTPATAITYDKTITSKAERLWSSPPSDDVSRAMANNLTTHASLGTLSSLLNGLGSKLINGFLKTQSNFEQTVVAYRYGARGASALDATTNASAIKSAKNLSNNISLKIHTASGKDVEIAITFGGDGQSIQDSLSVEIHSSAKLTAAEQAAIAKLSKGFDAALQGIGGDAPTVDVSGLVDFDTTVLSGVDLSVRATSATNGLQALDFHADATRRSLTMQSAAGRVGVAVDLSAPATWGSRAQQQSAVQNYLNQFDAANKRAHAGLVLLEQFKDAFAQLNSDYPSANQTKGTLPVLSLSDKDRSVLSGLGDFQASMRGDFYNGSPTHVITEAGHIDYQISQHTKTNGEFKSRDLSVAQTQSAKLIASFAKSRSGAMLDPKAGNYDIYRINDENTATTAFEYSNGELKNAFVKTLTNQSEHYEKLLNHKIVEQKETPYKNFTVRDITEILRKAD